MEQIYFNPLQNFAAGRQMGEQQAGQNLLREYGGAAMQGDQNALNALAANPYTMDVAQGVIDRQQRQQNLDRDFGMQQQRLAISQEQLAMARDQARAEAERYAAAGRADEAAREAALTETYIGNLGAAYASGNQQMFNQMAANPPAGLEDMKGVTWETFPATASVVGASLEGVVEALQGPKPEYKYDNGQYWDANNPQAGAQQLPNYVGKEGDGFSVQLPDGTTVRQGAGAGQLPITDKPAKDFARTWDAERGEFVDTPIAGSDKALERREAEEKSAARDASAETAGDVVLNAALRAQQADADRWAGGALGAAAAYNPGSNNAEVYRQVAVLKSNASVENVNAMRQQSPTGGALGAVSDADVKMLQAKSGALDPASPHFARDLEDYTRTLLRVIHGREAGDATFAQRWNNPNGVQTASPAQVNAAATEQRIREQPDFMNMSEAQLTEWLRTNGGY